MARPTAPARWDGVTLSYDRASGLSTGIVELVPIPGTKSPSPLAMGAGEDIPKKDVGRAINTTPNSDIIAAICSILVNGSLIKIEHAQHASEGARKVITVASANGRYKSESRIMSKMPTHSVYMSITHSTSQTCHVLLVRVYYRNSL